MKNTVVQEAIGIKVPIMALSIKVKEDANIKSDSSGFQVTRRLIKNKNTGILVTHSAYFLFNEAYDHFHITTTFLKNRLKSDMQKSLLKRNFPLGVSRGGTVEMAGGRTALWMQERSEKMHMGVIWSCSEAESTTKLYHIATLKREDKTNKDIKDALITLTKRFECQ